MNNYNLKYSANGHILDIIIYMKLLNFFNMFSISADDEVEIIHNNYRSVNINYFEDKIEQKKDIVEESTTCIESTDNNVVESVDDEKRPYVNMMFVSFAAVMLGIAVSGK